MCRAKLILGLMILFGTTSALFAQENAPPPDQARPTQIAAVTLPQTVMPAIETVSQDIAPPGTIEDAGPINAIATHEPRALQKISY